VRQDDRISAIGATCTHYGGPLAEGLVVGDTVRCPWHHACFSLRTGAARGAPALDDVPCWTVTVRDGLAVVAGEPRAVPAPELDASSQPRSVVIIGGGAAGTAAAQRLRKEGYTGTLTVVDPEADAPYDRPNLSKDYLAGNAPEEWLPLRPADFYDAHDIDRRVVAATRVDTAERVVELSDGSRLSYDALLVATGARPVRPPIPGSELEHVVVLRSLADCRRLIAKAGEARTAVIIGAGFIGMEAAASLRARGLDVTVVAPEAVPLERVFGTAVGRFVQGLQEQHEVRLRLGRSVAGIEPDAVVLDDGSREPADLVLLAVGVRPDTALAEAAGLAVENGVVVDARLATDVPGVWAAGDIARFPDPRTGELIRVEHWVVAERQGQVAAQNILGRGVAFDDPPFFWTTLHGTSINYVGHATRWDEIREEGDLVGSGAGVFRYLEGGEIAAVTTVGEDMASLQAEAELATRARSGDAKGAPRS
jgi:3-phenylpropionate/trans-cinnamate dioxygenase ferredoxin reductase subunit